MFSWEENDLSVYFEILPCQWGVALWLPRWHSGQESSCQCRRHKERQVWSLGREDPLKEEMATHSSILAWKIPWTEEPDWATVHGVAKSWTWLSPHLTIAILHTIVEMDTDNRKLRISSIYPFSASLMVLLVKNPAANEKTWETWVLSLGWEDILEKGRSIHSSILAWRIPWREEPGRLQSMGSHRVGHD